MSKKYLTFLSVVILLVLALIVSGASCKRQTVSEEFGGKQTVEENIESQEAANRETVSQEADSEKSVVEEGQPEEENVGLANPASVKCEEDGGTIMNIETPLGTKGLCIFSDISICYQWDYFRDECKPGDCYRKCNAIGSRSEGWYNSCDNSLIQWDNCALDEPYKSKQHDFQVYFPAVIEQYEVEHEANQAVYSYLFVIPTTDTNWSGGEQFNVFTVNIYSSAQWQKLDSSQQSEQEKLVEMNNKVYAIEFCKDVPQDWQDKWNREAMNVVKDNFGLVFE